MDWATAYDVIDQVSTVLSIPLAVGGFWIAINQIGKTRTAAEAAQKASETARDDARRSSILILVPQLQNIESQIDRALEMDSIPLFISWSYTWRWQAGQLNEHLATTDRTEDRRLSTLLQESVLAAAAAKSSLINKPDADLKRATKRMRDSVTAVTNELGAVAAAQLSLPGRVNE